MLEDNLLIVCPNDTKEIILKEIAESKKMISIKFMDIKEFLDNYFFEYDYKTISYVVNKYNIKIDNVKMFLNNLYFIDVEKEYQNSKLLFLRDMKKDLIENNLLIINKGFFDYLKGKKIKVINYPKLDKYLLNVFSDLGATVEKNELINKKYSIIECNDMDSEISFVASKMLELKNNGVSFNNMFIVNYNENYFYTISKVFKEYDIPVELPLKANLLSTKIVQDFFVTGNIKNDNDISKLVINVVNKLVKIEDDDNYKKILKYALRNTRIKEKKYIESVKISSLFDRKFKENDYVFFIGYNDDVVPITYKDEDYITDNLKDEVELFTTREKNILEKKVTACYISNIPNLFISYKLNDFKDVYYRSNLFDDIEIIKYQDNLKYSNKHNERMLAIYLDNYYKYKEFNTNLYKLLNTYKEQYNTYSNDFKNELGNKLLDSLEEIKLSYTSMNMYNSCPFKYYVNYILKLDPFEENFVLLIGNLFHYVLELSYRDDFDFELVWNNYLNDKELSVKEEYLLNKLKKILLEELEILKEREEVTDFNSHYYEKEITIPLDNDKVSASFVGKIDKIMYYKEINNTYYAIVDYKTGSFPDSLNNMKYGLDMQLATYLYLIEKGNVFESPILAGMYFEKVLMNNGSFDKKKSFSDRLRDNLKFVGYSTDQEDILKHLDHNYKSSSLIKGLRFGNNGIYKNSKVLSSDDEYNIFKYTEKKIYEALDNILDAKFSIDPKKIGTTYDSCSLCKYHDLCFRKEADYSILEKVNNLDFLEGDSDA